MSTLELASWPEHSCSRRQAGLPLLALLMIAIVGQVMAFLLLWHLGFWLALLGAPFGGVALWVLAAALATNCAVSEHTWDHSRSGSF